MSTSPKFEPTESEVVSEPIRDAEALIQEGQGLVRSIALNVFRSLPLPTDLDDLIAYGQLGLAQAAQGYDPKVGARFTTFAYYRIRGAIYDGVSKMTWTSRARLRRLRFQQMANDVLEDEQELQVANSVDGDAAWFGRVTERLAVVFLASSDEDSVCRSISEAADPHESPSKQVASRELQLKLHKLVDQLPADARRLVSSIYFEGYTLTQAAERAGISKSWASRLHAKSLDLLAKELHALGGD